MSAVSRLKWLALLAVFVLMLIVAFQNLAEIEVRMLFWKGTLPQAVVLAITVAIGFLMGLAVGAMHRMRAWRHRQRTTKEEGSAESPAPLR